MDYTIAPTCPWYEAQQYFGPPNVNWCEPTICALINEPANTWSNLGYMIVGLYFIFPKGSQGFRLLFHYGVIIFLMGLMSFLYHATNNFLTQIFDFLGMFGLTSILLALQYTRLKEKSLHGYWPAFTGIFLFQCLLFYFAHWHGIFPIQSIIAIMAAPILVLETILFVKEKEKRRRRRFFLGGFVMLVVAVSFSLLDHHRIWCQPENLILHGHVLWHLIGAVAMGLLGLHLKEISRLS